MITNREQAIATIAATLELLGANDEAKDFQRRAVTTPNLGGVVQIARQYLALRPQGVERAAGR